MTSRVLVGLVLALAWSAPRARAAEDGAALLEAGRARVGAELEPSDMVHVGERVTFRIEFLSSTWFAGAPRLPEIEIRGAITRKAGDLAINGSRTIEGETYASQIWEYWIYPRRAGPLRVPPQDVVFVVAGEDRQKVEVRATTPALDLVVEIPTGAEGLDFQLATPTFEIEETWDPRPETLMVGDAFKRTITMTVRDAPGMLIEPLSVWKLDGAAVYPAPPQVEDDVNRGEIVGHRTESATFVMQRPGTYTVDAIRIPWFNVETKRLESAELEALTFVVEPNPSLPAIAEGGDGMAPGSRPPAFPWIPLLVLTAAVGGGLLWWSRRGPAWRAAREAERQARADAEPARFERVLAACRDAAPAEAYRRLLAWIDALVPPTTLTALTSAQPTPALGDEVKALQDRLYGSAPASTAWAGHELAAALAETRARLQATHAVHAPALPPLNPSE